MSEIVTQLLSLIQGEDLYRILKVLFLTFLCLATLAILFAPKPAAGTVTYGLLRIGTTGFLLAILLHQATWQISGFTRREFVRFQQRYNKRPYAAERHVLRAPILDCRGHVLAAPIVGQPWGRRYPLGEAGVHPIGYFHSRFGITGVERLYDATLSGYSEDDPISQAKGVFTPRAEEGQPITLTLDARLQIQAYEALGNRKGAIIVIHPPSGTLLALASSPGFDPNNPGPAASDTDNAPAFNRATQGRYPPGSTFKILVAALALERGLDPSFHCPAMGYIAGPHTPPIRDSEYYAFERRGEVWPGWGKLNLRNAMIHSSNVYFAQLSEACGTEAFNAMMRQAHINDALDYLLGPNGASIASAKGNVPVVSKKARLAPLGIGQGEVLVTPLHVACFTAAIAADGLLMYPRLGKTDPIRKLATLCSPQVASHLRSILRDVVTQGTGKGADIPGLGVCGKTGTAQVAGAEDHAWFTCFAPQHQPQIAVTVLIENGGFGAAAALPAARQLLKEADRLGYLHRTTGGTRP